MQFKEKVTWMFLAILLLPGYGWAARSSEALNATLLLPDASLSAPAEVCAGSGELTFNVCNGAPPFMVHYTVDQGSVVVTDSLKVNSTEQTINIDATRDVTYQIIYIRDADDLVRTTNFSPAATAHVKVNPLPDASLDISSNSVCPEDELSLIFNFCEGMAPFEVTYSVTTSESTVFKTIGGLENGTSVTIPVPEQDATYTITSVTDFNGCTRSSGFNTTHATESVALNPLPAGRLVAQTRDICLGETVSLLFESTGAAPGEKFDLTYSDGSKSRTLVGMEHGGIIQVTPQTSTHYFLVSLKSENCERTEGFNDDATVSVHIPVDFSAQTVCAKKATVFTVENSIPGATYTWDFNGDGIVDKSTTETVVEHVYQDKGTYQATLNTGSSTFCPATVTKNIVIPRSPEVFAGNDTTIIQGDGFTIPATSNGYYSYQWTPVAGLSNPALLNPQASPTETTRYTLTATTAEGCTVSAEILVTVEEEENQKEEEEEEKPAALKIYNSFTPDNDHYNDVWIIDGIEDYPHNMVAIFDRWGNQLFLSRGYNQPWDGTSKGKGLEPGTYYYVVSLNNGAPPIKGTVNIIR